MSLGLHIFCIASSHSKHYAVLVKNTVKGHVRTGPFQKHLPIYLLKKDRLEKCALPLEDNGKITKVF